jgi:hypothetical protein
MLEKSRIYLNKLISGNVPLIVVFWLWFIFISICIEIFMQIGFKSDKENIYLEFFVYFLILLYSIFIFFITFKSASRYEGSKFWSFSAKTLVTLNLFFSLAFFIETYKYYFLEDYYIQKDIEDFKKNLPIQVDLNSVLIDIYKDGKSIFYKYTLFGVDLSNEKTKNIFTKQVKDSLCESETTVELLKKDYILAYKYTNENDEELLDIKTKKEDCGESIYDLDIVNSLLKHQGV